MGGGEVEMDVVLGWLMKRKEGFRFG